MIDPTALFSLKHTSKKMSKNLDAIFEIQHKPIMKRYRLERQKFETSQKKKDNEVKKKKIVIRCISFRGGKGKQIYPCMQALDHVNLK